MVKLHFDRFPQQTLLKRRRNWLPTGDEEGVSQPLRDPSEPLYWKLNLAAVLCHGVNVAFMLGVYYGGNLDTGEIHQDVCYNVTASYGTWLSDDERLDAADTFVVKKTQLFQLSLHWLIVCFHALSFVFQLIPVLMKATYMEWVDEGRNPLRFVEYAASASIMLVCIALLNAVEDVNELGAIFALCVLTQILGLLAEDLHAKKPSQKSLVASLHFLGWFSITAAYGLIWVHFGVALQNAAPGRTPPDFVYAIVILLYLLFNMFGAVQLLQVYSLETLRCGACCRWCTSIESKHLSEVWFTFLSLFAKTLLGWMLYANVVVMGKAGCEQMYH